MSSINVGLLECNSPERYEALGRLVVDCLMRPESRKQIGNTGIYVREITVSGS